MRPTLRSSYLKSSIVAFSGYFFAAESVSIFAAAAATPLLSASNIVCCAKVGA